MSRVVEIQIKLMRFWSLN